jgi:hypothetical protein
MIINRTHEILGTARSVHNLKFMFLKGKFVMSHISVAPHGDNACKYG